MWHSVLFLSGFLLAYVIMSRRLRQYTLAALSSYLMLIFPKRRRQIVALPTGGNKDDEVIQAAIDRLPKTGGMVGGKLVVDEDTVAEWQANLERAK